MPVLTMPMRTPAPASGSLLSGSSASLALSARAAWLRALAVTTATRAEALPDAPTVAESLPGYEASGWAGLGAPRNTPTFRRISCVPSFHKKKRNAASITHHDRCLCPPKAATGFVGSRV